MHTLICVTVCLTPGVRGWLRLLLVALPGLFCLLFSSTILALVIPVSSLLHKYYGTQNTNLPLNTVTGQAMKDSNILNFDTDDERHMMTI